MTGRTLALAFRRAGLNVLSMSSSPKPLVVPRCCLAMAVALEVVAEHRRARTQADVADEAAAAAARAGERKAKRRQGRAGSKR